MRCNQNAGSFVFLCYSSRKDPGFFNWSVLIRVNVVNTRQSDT